MVNEEWRAKFWLFKKMLHHVITRALSCSLNLTTYLFCKSDTGGDRNEAKAKSGTKAKPSFQTTACGSFHLASSRRIWSFALFKARVSLKVDLFVWGCFSIYFCIYQDHPVLGAKGTVGFCQILEGFLAWAQTQLDDLQKTKMVSYRLSAQGLLWWIHFPDKNLLQKFTVNTGL